MQKYVQISKKAEIEKSKVREYSVFKTRHLRNQEQIVIILKTSTYYFHIIGHIEFNNYKMYNTALFG